MVQTRSMTEANRSINIRLAASQDDRVAVPDRGTLIYPSLGKFLSNQFFHCSRFSMFMFSIFSDVDEPGAFNLEPICEEERVHGPSMWARFGRGCRMLIVAVRAALGLLGGAYAVYGIYERFFSENEEEIEKLEVIMTQTVIRRPMLN